MLLAVISGVAELDLEVCKLRCQRIVFAGQRLQIGLGFVIGVERAAHGIRQLTDQGAQFGKLLLVGVVLAFEAGEQAVNFVLETREHLGLIADLFELQCDLFGGSKQIVRVGFSAGEGAVLGAE
ncbi:hypothetical protein D3C86_1337700 [compost metagenome]